LNGSARTRLVASQRLRLVALGGAAALGVVLAACAGDTANIEVTRSGFSCLDDSQECIGRRQAALAQLQSDPKRAWMRESPTPEAYASGVRLFAMKTRKHELSCEELTRAKTEADQAPGAIRSLGNRITNAQASRSLMLATEISREMSGEFARRCRRG
jgi:hypothetical protein